MTLPDEAIEAAAQALHADGWTCTGHEPLGCDTCDRLTRKAASDLLTAARYFAAHPEPIPAEYECTSGNCPVKIYTGGPNSDDCPYCGFVGSQIDE